MSVKDVVASVPPSHRSGTPEKSPAPGLLRPVRPPPRARRRGRRGGRGPALRRLPAGVAHLPGELRRVQHAAHGLGHAARQPLAAWLVPVGRLVLHHRAARVRGPRAAVRPAYRHRPYRCGGDLHPGPGARRAAGPGPCRPAGGIWRPCSAADAADGRHHVRPPARGRGVRPAAVRRAHRHRRAAHADLAGARPARRGPHGQAALAGPGPRRAAADLGADRRPARAQSSASSRSWRCAWYAWQVRWPPSSGRRAGNRGSGDGRGPACGPACGRAPGSCPWRARRSWPRCSPRWSAGCSGPAAGSSCIRWVISSRRRIPGPSTPG